MAKVEREILAEGNAHVVECAVVADGTSPAKDFLDDLEIGMWEPDPDSEELPDDAQIKHYDKLMSWFELKAEYGLPPYAKAVNYLENGIWEYKLGSRRLSYYDTPGDGSFEAKVKIKQRDQSEYAQDPSFWWYPRMDEFVRIGHVFPKNSQQTPPEDLQKCDQVRLEDVQHDVTD